MTEDLHVDYFTEVQELRAKLAETERERDEMKNVAFYYDMVLKDVVKWLGLDLDTADHKGICEALAQLRAELAVAKERERAAVRVVDAAEEMLDVLDNAPDEMSNSELRRTVAAYRAAFSEVLS